MNNMQTIVNNEIKNQREYMDIQRKRIVELKKMKSDIEKGKKVDDQKVISFIQKFILNYSHFVLVVVEKLGYAEQKLLMQ